MKGQSSLESFIVQLSIFLHSSGGNFPLLCMTAERKQVYLAQIYMVIFFPFLSCDEVIQLKAGYIQITIEFIQVYRKVSFDFVLGSIQHEIIWRDPFDFCFDIWGQFCAIPWGKYFVFLITVISPSSFSLSTSSSLHIITFVNMVKSKNRNICHCLQ